MTRSPRLAEPATVVTDLAIAAACAYFAARLASRDWPDWGGFALAAAASLAGAIVHGFPNRFGARVHDALWMASVLLAGYAAIVLAIGVAARTWSYAAQPALLLSPAVAVAYTAVVVRKPVFRYAARMSAIAGAAIGAAAVSLVDRNPAASALLAATVALSALGVAVQRRGIAPHPGFNHNDLYHVLQLAAFACLYAAHLRLPP